jgi:pimeloyl-ACP methyl ester carboxylesterase
VNAALADRLRGSAQAAAAAEAERGYSLRARLAQVAVPLLVLRLRDQTRDVPPRARLVELPEHGASLFETAPEAAAQALESFLR